MTDDGGLRLSGCAGSEDQKSKSAIATLRNSVCRKRGIAILGKLARRCRVHSDRHQHTRLVRAYNLRVAASNLGAKSCRR